MKQTPTGIQSYTDFWPYYLAEHRNRTNKILHVIGLCVGAVAATRLWSLLGAFGLIPSLMISYSFAWTGHFVFEKNRPATWRYPVWSLVSEFRMVTGILIGKIKL